MDPTDLTKELGKPYEFYSTAEAAAMKRLLDNHGTTKSDGQ